MTGRKLKSLFTKYGKTHSDIIAWAAKNGCKLSYSHVYRSERGEINEIMELIFRAYFQVCELELELAEMAIELKGISLEYNPFLTEEEYDNSLKK